MNTLIILTLLDLIVTWKFIGLSTCAIAAIITWLLFAGRKIGYFCRMNTLLVWEGLGIFFMVAYQMIMKNVHIKTILFALVLRAIFLGIVKYDMTAYVYVTEERRKEQE